MRKLLHKGKRKDTGELIEGYFLKTQEHTYIVLAEQFDDDLFLSPKNICFEVIPETVGAYTGINDKNGQGVFEKDIIKYQKTVGTKTNCTTLTITANIYFNEKTTSFAAYGRDEAGGRHYDHFAIYDVEIIGQTYDVLLGGAE